MDIKNINQNLVNGRLNESGNGAPKILAGRVPLNRMPALTKSR